MIRKILIAGAAILAAACFACVPPPPPSLAGAMATVAATCPDTTSFLSHVQYLTSGYAAGSDYKDDPTPGSPIDANSPYAAALQNAFLLAPRQVQQQLCNLGGTDNTGIYRAGIYINGASCPDFDSCFANSWGYRAKSNMSYIAISSGLWSPDRLKPYPGAISYVYHLYETDVLDSLVAFDPSLSSYRPQYASANPAADNFDMTILAAMAHELGHVRWYQVVGPQNWGNDYKQNKFCESADGSTTFFTGSWVTPVNKPPRWRIYQDRNARGNGYGSVDSHLSTPQISTIDAYINQRDISYAAYLIDQLHNSAAPWASYFAALSPDEDFVETFKLYVLMNAQTVRSEGPLTSLKVQIYDGLGGAYTEDIPNDYLIPSNHSKKATLAFKIACIANSMARH